MGRVWIPPDLSQIHQSEDLRGNLNSNIANAAHIMHLMSIMGVISSNDQNEIKDNLLMKT